MSAPSIPSPSAPDTAADLRSKVLVRGRKRVARWLWRGVGVLVLGGAGLGGFAWYGADTEEAGPRWDTRTVERGDLRATVSATGTLSGRDTLEVGAQVTGAIKKIHVDFNDPVKQGQILLEIDPDQLEATRNQAQARLISARASHRSAQATAHELTASAKRKAELAKLGLVSDSELEAVQAAAARAAAAIESAAAEISVANANLAAAQTSLDKTVIRSPIDGVVLSRNVEEGQTVTASLQTPILFLLARDLKQMELSVGIDEADVGRVKEGQTATFTVDAHPNREFAASLRSLRNVATTTENIVTYQAVLDLENDGSLRPGMTATVSIITEQKQDVVLVPNAALRFVPPPRKRSTPNPLTMLGRRGRGGGGRKPPAAGSVAAPPLSADQPRVWVLAERKDGKPAFPRPRGVKLGVSDERHTEILEGIDSGAIVVVDVLAEPE